ncbi:MAG: hypothetical protein ABI193_06795, partial [Minicystis sp.]
IGRWGEKTPAIPAELNLAQALRLAGREEERLRVSLRKKRDELTAWLAGCGLAEALAPTEEDDALSWSRQLEAARDQRLLLQPHLDALVRRGLTVQVDEPADWAAVREALLARVERADEEQRALSRRYDEAADRARRLGGASLKNPVADLTALAATTVVDALERDVERLRSLRLRDCSPEAREVYTALQSGDAGALPDAVAELLRLGLIRTVEDAR